MPSNLEACKRGLRVWEFGETIFCFSAVRLEPGQTNVVLSLLRAFFLVIFSPRFLPFGAQGYAGVSGSVSPPPWPHLLGAEDVGARPAGSRSAPQCCRGQCPRSTQVTRSCRVWPHFRVSASVIPKIWYTCLSRKYSRSMPKMLSGRESPSFIVSGTDSLYFTNTRLMNIWWTNTRREHNFNLS